MTDRLLGIVEELSQQNPFSGHDGLADPPRPSEAAIPRDRPSADQIPYIQRQISVLTYNHLPRTFFSLEKHRSLQSILFTAKEVLAEALPIRCLEATFVALHYTQSLRDIDRIPLSFKSEANGNFYRHIVLVLRTRANQPLYGALGLSRKSTLMYKPLTYRSLFDVVMDYKREYETLGHELLDIKLGIAITHDEHSRWDPCWRFIALKLDHYRTAPATDTAEADGSSKPPGLCTPEGQLPHASPLSDYFASTGSFAGAPGSLPPLSLCGSRSYHGETQLERSAKVAEGAAGEAGRARPAHLSPLSTSGSVLSPTVPSASAVSATPAANGGGASSREAYAPLAQLLSSYMRLLPTICEQYYKGIASLDNNRAARLCFMDLDTAERDAGIENQRRLQCISEMQSPLSTEARRVAATRQLKPPRKERGTAKGGNRGSGTRRRLASSTSSASGAVKSARTPPTPASPASPSPIGAPEGRRVPAQSVVYRQRPAQAPAPSVVLNLTASPAPPTMPSAAELNRSASLQAALVSIGHMARTCLPHHSLLVEAQNTGSSASPHRRSPCGTEGYATPGNASPGGRSDDVLAAPPFTPRHYDERKPYTPYAASLNSSLTSASDLYSPGAHDVTATHTPRWSP